MAKGLLNKSMLTKQRKVKNPRKRPGRLQRHGKSSSRKVPESLEEKDKLVSFRRKFRQITSRATLNMKRSFDKIRSSRSIRRPPTKESVNIYQKPQERLEPVHLDNDLFELDEYLMKTQPPQFPTRRSEESDLMKNTLKCKKRDSAYPVVSDETKYIQVKKTINDTYYESFNRRLDQNDKQIFYNENILRMSSGRDNQINWVDADQTSLVSKGSVDLVQNSKSINDDSSEGQVLSNHSDQFQYNKNNFRKITNIFNSNTQDLMIENLPRVKFDARDFSSKVNSGRASSDGESISKNNSFFYGSRRDRQVVQNVSCLEKNIQVVKHLPKEDGDEKDANKCKENKEQIIWNGEEDQTFESLNEPELKSHIVFQKRVETHGKPKKPLLCTHYPRSTGILEKLEFGDHYRYLTQYHTIISRSPKDQASLRLDCLDPRVRNKFFQWFLLFIVQLYPDHFSEVALTAFPLITRFFGTLRSFEFSDYFFKLTALAVLRIATTLLGVSTHSTGDVIRNLQSNKFKLVLFVEKKRDPGANVDWEFSNLEKWVQSQQRLSRRYFKRNRGGRPNTKRGNRVSRLKIMFPLTEVNVLKAYSFIIKRVGCRINEPSLKEYIRETLKSVFDKNLLLEMSNAFEDFEFNPETQNYQRGDFNLFGKSRGLKIHPKPQNFRDYFRNQRLLLDFNLESIHTIFSPDDRELRSKPVELLLLKEELSNFLTNANCKQYSVHDLEGLLLNRSSPRAYEHILEFLTRRSCFYGLSAFLQGELGQVEFRSLALGCVKLAISDLSTKSLDFFVQLDSEHPSEFEARLKGLVAQTFPNFKRVNQVSDFQMSGTYFHQGDSAQTFSTSNPLDFRLPERGSHKSGPSLDLYGRSLLFRNQSSVGRLLPQKARSVRPLRNPETPLDLYRSIGDYQKLKTENCLEKPGKHNQLREQKAPDSKVSIHGVGEENPTTPNSYFTYKEFKQRVEEGQTKDLEIKVQMSPNRLLDRNQYAHLRNHFHNYFLFQFNSATSEFYCDDRINAIIEAIRKKNKEVLSNFKLFSFCRRFFRQGELCLVL